MSQVNCRSRITAIDEDRDEVIAVLQESKSPLLGPHCFGLPAPGFHHFAAMKTGAALLNTARATVIDEPEMIEVLRRRPDLIALLEVTSPEPPPFGSPLYNLENIVITPHIAGSLGLECRRMGSVMVDEFERLLNGRSMLYEISEERIAQIA